MALKFNGSTSFIDFGDVFDLAQLDAVTVEFWAKINATTGCKYVCSKQLGSGLFPGYDIFTADCFSAGDLAWRIGENNVGGKRIYVRTNVGNVDDGAWHHWAIVQTGLDLTSASIFFYRDGFELAKTQSDTGAGASENSSEPLKFGKAYGGDFFDGELTECRIWNYQRSPAEIRAGMFRRMNGTERGLIFLAPMRNDASVVRNMPTKEIWKRNAARMFGGTPTGITVTADPKYLASVSTVRKAWLISMAQTFVEDVAATIVSQLAETDAAIRSETGTSMAIASVLTRIDQMIAAELQRSFVIVSILGEADQLALKIRNAVVKAFEVKAHGRAVAVTPGGGAKQDKANT